MFVLHRISLQHAHLLTRPPLEGALEVQALRDQQVVYFSGVVFKRGQRDKGSISVNFVFIS